MASGVVTVKILGDAKGLEGALGSAEGKLGTFAKAGAAAFAVLATAAAGIAVGLFKVGESFDKEFDKIRVGTGATGQALEGLEGSFKNVLKTVPTDFASAGTAIADLNTRLGLTGEPLENLAGQFINLSRITGGDVKTSIDNVTRVFGDWGTAVEDQAGTMDMLYRAAQSSGIGLDALSTSLVQFGAPLRNLGFGLDESMALLAQFNKTGVNTETVFAGLKAGVGKLAKEGEAIPETFRRIVTEIEAMGPGTEATGKAIELFGQRAGPDLADAIAGGKFSIDEMLGAIRDGEDTITKAAEDTADFGEKWTLIKNRVLVGLEPLATKVFDGVGAAMDRLGPHVETLIAWFQEHIPPTIDRLAVLFEEWAPRVVAVFERVRAVAQQVADFFMTHIAPLFESALALIQAIVGRFVAIVQNLWARFGAQLLSHIETAFNAIKQAVQGALAVIKGIIDLFTGILTGDWSKAWDGIKQIVTGAWDVIVGVVKMAINNVSAMIGVAMAGISALWGLAWNSFKTIVSDAFGGIASAVGAGIGKAVDLVAGLPGKILGALGDMSRLLFDVGKSIVQGLIDGVTSVFGKVRDQFSKLTDLIPDWKGPPDKDRRLLAPAGKAIMGGLIRSIDSERGALRSKLGQVTGDIGLGAAGLRAGAGVGVGGNRTIHIDNVNVATGRTFAEEMVLAEALYGQGL